MYSGIIKFYETTNTAEFKKCALMQRPHHTFHSDVGSQFFRVVLKLLPPTVSPLAAAHVPFPWNLLKIVCKAFYQS
jgi:hypothetical protein